MYFLPQAALCLIGVITVQAIISDHLLVKRQIDDHTIHPAVAKVIIEDAGADDGNALVNYLIGLAIAENRLFDPQLAGQIVDLFGNYALASQGPGLDLLGSLSEIKNSAYQGAKPSKNVPLQLRGNVGGIPYSAAKFAYAMTELAKEKAQGNFPDWHFTYSLIRYLLELILENQLIIPDLATKAAKNKG